MVTLELPPTVEEKLRAKAEAEGLTLESLLLRAAEREVEVPPVHPTRAPMRGRLAHIPSDLSFEELQAFRREMWANFPREFPDTEAK